MASLPVVVNEEAEVVVAVVWWCSFETAKLVFQKEVCVCVWAWVWVWAWAHRRGSERTQEGGGCVPEHAPVRGSNTWSHVGCVDRGRRRSAETATLVFQKEAWVLGVGVWVWAWACIGGAVSVHRKGGAVCPNTHPCGAATPGRMSVVSTDS